MGNEPSAEQNGTEDTGNVSDSESDAATSPGLSRKCRIWRGVGIFIGHAGLNALFGWIAISAFESALSIVDGVQHVHVGMVVVGGLFILAMLWLNVFLCDRTVYCP